MSKRSPAFPEVQTDETELFGAASRASMRLPTAARSTGTEGPPTDASSSSQRKTLSVPVAACTSQIAATTRLRYRWRALMLILDLRRARVRGFPGCTTHQAGEDVATLQRRDSRIRTKLRR